LNLENKVYSPAKKNRRESKLGGGTLNFMKKQKILEHLELKKQQFHWQEKSILLKIKKMEKEVD
jgi:hypothetical protein